MRCITRVPAQVNWVSAVCGAGRDEAAPIGKFEETPLPTSRGDGGVGHILTQRADVQ